MSYAQIYHARNEMRALGLTPAQISPDLSGDIAAALSPLVKALGGRIISAEASQVKIRLNNNTPHSAETFGGIVAGLTNHDALVTQISRRQVIIDFTR